VHDLRHTAATLVISSPAPLAAISKTLRRPTLSTTNLFGHVVRHAARDAVTALGNAQERRTHASGARNFGARSSPGRTKPRARICGSGRSGRSVCGQGKLAAMSNSYAQPILRTPELAVAVRVAERLLEIADTTELQVDVEARVFSDDALPELLDLLPDAERWSEQDETTSSETSDVPTSNLPVWIQKWGMSPSVTEPVLAALGDNSAAVRWDFSGWPEAPEIGLGIGGSRGAFVTLCVNARDLDLSDRSRDHSVFVHVKQVEAERAPWLAARVGLRVIGELVMSPH
jgi:hypothetical protein